MEKNNDEQSPIKNPIDVFEILDIIKMHLNKLLVKGLTSVEKEDIEIIEDLIKKLQKIKINTIADILIKFLELYQKKKTKQIKQEFARTILKLNAVNRSFERIISIELVKNSLI